MQTFEAWEQEQTADDDAMSVLTSLSKGETGLPMVVWIEVKRPSESQTPRMQFSNSERNGLLPNSLVPISLDKDCPRILVDGVKLNIPNKDLEDLKRWIKSNHEGLMKVWNGNLSPFQFMGLMTKLDR